MRFCHVGGAGILPRQRQRALVAVLVVELVVPLQDELAGPQGLWGGLWGELAGGLGLAELPGEVAGARGAQDGGGGVKV